MKYALNNYCIPDGSPKHSTDSENATSSHNALLPGGTDPAALGMQLCNCDSWIVEEL